MEKHTITLGKRSYVFSLPDSFADREDIVSAWHKGRTSFASRRIFAGTLGACLTGLAAEVKGPSWEDAQGDLVGWGKRYYDHLRGQGMTGVEIETAARTVFQEIHKSLFPRKDEVEAAEDFTKGGAQAT